MANKISKALYDEIVYRMSQQQGRADTVRNVYVDLLRNEGLIGLADKLEKHVGIAIGVNAQIVLDEINKAEVITVPEPPTTGNFIPPPRTKTVTNAPEGTEVQEDTHYIDPIGYLRYPANVKHVTVTGLTRIGAGQVFRGCQDLHIEGYPDRYIETGPRHDGGDGIQIKREAGGQVPENIVIRYWRPHDIDRRDKPLKHSDGIQIMCARNLTLVDCKAERVAVQPYFVRDSGYDAGGGPVEDITFLRCSSEGQPEGYYSFKISGDDEVGQEGRYVPTRVKIIDCAADKSPNISAAAQANGSEVINWTDL